MTWTQNRHLRREWQNPHHVSLEVDGVNALLRVDGEVFDIRGDELTQVIVFTKSKKGDQGEKNG